MPTRLVLLTLLPLLSLGGWFLLARGPEPGEVASPGERSAAAPGAGPLLEGQRPLGSDTPPAHPGAATRSAGSSMRIFGDIVLPPGVEAGVGVVAIVLAHEDPRSVLARQRLSDGLTFDWSLPNPTGSDPCLLEVVLYVPGLARLAVAIEGRGGGEERVTLRPTRLPMDAPKIEGRLTDHHGRALEGFHMVLRDMVLRDMELRLVGVDSLNGMDDLIRSESGSKGAILVTTGPDGRFEAQSPASQSLWATSLDLHWIVHFARIRPGQGPVELQASPAARVRGTVRDAATGEPLADHQRTIYVHHGGRIVGTYGWGGSDAAFDWATGVTDWGRGPLEIAVRVEARLYAPFEARFHPGPDGLDETLDIALRPLTPAEIGELTVVVGIRDAQGRTLGATLAKRVERDGSTSASGLTPEPPALGNNERLVYRMAAGTHLLSLALDGSFGTLMRWKGEVTVPGGGRTVLQVPWTPHGSLRLRYRPFAAGQQRLSLNLRHAVTGDNVGFDPEATACETWIPALPAGTWVLTDHSHTPPTERTLEIAAGAETVIDVEP